MMIHFDDTYDVDLPTYPLLPFVHCYPVVHPNELQVCLDQTRKGASTPTAAPRTHVRSIRLTGHIGVQIASNLS